MKPITLYIYCIIVILFCDKRFTANSQSKEIIYAFYSENGDRETPILSNEKIEYKVQTIVFNKKEDKYKLEVIDKSGRYFYLEKKIDLIKLKE